VIVGGIYWLQRNQTGGKTGTGELIAAQEGDYKVKPDEAGGKTFEGEGDSAFAASEGKKTDATIAVPAKGEDGNVTANTVATSAPAANGPAPAGAVMVQLGAFGDAAKADAAWAAFGKRFGFLAGVNRKVADASGEGGRKIYRLQAVTANAAAAQQLCAKLKAAGENCLIIK
jgi:cell division protein FtsN